MAIDLNTPATSTALSSKSDSGSLGQNPYEAAGATLVKKQNPYVLAGATPVAQSSSSDYVMAGVSPVKPLSDDEFQSKLKSRWGAMLTGKAAASPADLQEMAVSGRFTPTQLQSAQQEAYLRSLYSQEKGKSLGAQAWDAIKSGAKTITGSAAEASMIPAISEVASHPGGFWNDVARLGASAYEGTSNLLGGAARFGGRIFSGAGKSVKNAYNYYTGQQPAPDQAEQDYQTWKQQYLNEHLELNGLQPESQFAFASHLYNKALGLPGAEIKPENLPQPYAHLSNAVSFWGGIPLYGAAFSVPGRIAGSGLEVAGARAVAPNLLNYLKPLSSEGQMQNAVNQTIEGRPVVTPSLASKAVGIGGKAAQLPGNLVDAASRGAKALIEKAANQVELGDLGEVSAGAILGEHIPHLASLAKVVAGAKTAQAVGKFTEDLVNADANAFGPLQAMASNPELNPLARIIARSFISRSLGAAGNLLKESGKGALKGAVQGAALGLVARDNPDEFGADVGTMAAFGAAHGAINSKEATLFRYNLNNIGRFVQQSLADGTNPETLKSLSDANPQLVSNAATLENVLKNNWKIRFASPADPRSPFSPDEVAAGQSGYYQPAAKTIWVSTEGRDPNATLVHEAFHGIADSLVANHPEIADTINKALADNGKTLDEAKQAYVEAELGYPEDSPETRQLISERIAQRDASNPNWIVGEVLSEASARALTGKSIQKAAISKSAPPDLSAVVKNPNVVQMALSGIRSVLNVLGVSNLSPEAQEYRPATVLKHFEDALDTPGLRKLTYQLLRAQKNYFPKLSKAAEQGVTVKPEMMGGKEAPMYKTATGQQINPYGQMVPDGKGGQKFKLFPPSELMRRLKNEQAALDQYIPKGTPVARVPDALLNDSRLNPWTRQALLTLQQASEAKQPLGLYYHRLNGENTATSGKSWKTDVKRTLGNTTVSYQEGFPIGLKRTKVGNLVEDWASIQAIKQKAAIWADSHGELSLDLWNGNIADFNTDLAAYLKNHAEGAPGESNGIGTVKKDVLNAFVFGDNREMAERNPLRAKLKGANRKGIFRSLRVDRMESAVPIESSLEVPIWEKGKANFSPNTDQPGEPWQEPPDRGLNDDELNIVSQRLATQPAKYLQTLRDFDPETASDVIDKLPTGTVAQLLKAADRKAYGSRPKRVAALKEWVNEGHSGDNQTQGEYSFSPNTDENSEGVYLAGESIDDYEGSPPSVNWEEPDLPINGPWTEKKVAKEAGVKEGYPIYRSMIPISELYPKLSEEEEDGEFEPGEGYDWSELQRRHSSPPPVVVRRGKDGKFTILDGNHRIHFWEQSGYDLAPAWVVDDLIAADIKKKAGQFSPATQEKQEIEITGPDGKKYPATFDGMQDFTAIGGGLTPQITPKVDIPGVIKAGSTTYAPRLEQAGYALPEMLQKSPSGLKSGQFSPSTAPEAVKEAAVRDKDGNIYTGPMHALAAMQYYNAKYPGDAYNDLRGWSNQDGLEEGFVTNNGEFLTREQAFARAKKLKQYQPKAAGEAELESGRFNSQQGLTASGEPKVAQIFSPATEAGAKPNNREELKKAREAWLKQGTASPYFQRWFGDSKVRDDAGKPLVVYSGHSNAELYGDKYQPHKGTAGGFYASESPQVASSYAMGKFGVNEYYENGEQYRLTGKNGKFNKKLWQIKLTPEQQQVARDFLNSEEGGNLDFERWVREHGPFDADARRAGYRGGLRDLFSIYKFLENMSSTIAYDKDDPTGELSAVERQQTNTFEDLLNRLGFKWQSYDWRAPGVYPIYLSIRKPLDASQPFPPDLLAALEKAARYTRRGNDLVSHWTKDYPLKAWMDDIKSGNEYWTTQVPAKAIQLIKQFGYDGIKELGLKGAANLPRDQRHINWIAFDPEQIKSASGNRGMFDANNPSMLFSPQTKNGTGNANEDDMRSERPVFYSQLQKTVDNKFTGKQMPAAQLAAILRNPQNGVKADELKWSGLDDFLKGKGKVTREEVQDFLKENAVQLKEVVKGRSPNLPDGVYTSGQAEFHRGSQLWELLPNGGAGKVGPGDALDPDLYYAVGDTFPQTLNKAIIRGLYKGLGDTKFANYQLPGGENYREILFQLPDSDRQKAMQAQKAIRDTISRDMAQHPELLELQQRLKEAQQRGVMSENETPPPGYGNDYQFKDWRNSDTHWSAYPPNTAEETGEARNQYNTWAWRDYYEQLDRKWTTELEKIFGDRYRRIESLGAVARNSGFKSPHWNEPNVVAHARVNDRVDAEGEPGLLIEEEQSDWHQTGRKKGYGLIQFKVQKEGTEWTARYPDGRLYASGSEQHVRDTIDNEKVVGVPDAPWKKDWHEMVFRRLVRLAAEEGKQWVGWTTGEQQAERYDLSKQVGKIHYAGDGPNKWFITVTGIEGERLLERSAQTESDLENLIGKDAAKKITEGAGHEVGAPARTGVLEGEDLKVGGEGMKGFYDKILTDYARKFGKKFGAVVKDRRIPTEKGDIGGVPARYPDLLEVHSLTITPEMRKSVLNEGVQLFSPSAAKKEEDRTGYWHGTASGDLRGGTTGLHVGTYQAAKQALEASIGRPATGTWDGTREYGKTLLAGQNHFAASGDTPTGYNARAPLENYYPGPAHPEGFPKHSNGESIRPEYKPDILPVDIIGKMTGKPENPRRDFYANGVMRQRLKKGNARRGYYYRNEAEDEGSISAVVPNATFLKVKGEPQLRLFSPSTQQTESPAFKKWFGDSVAKKSDGTPLVFYHGTTDPDIKQAGGAWFTTDPRVADLYSQRQAYMNSPEYEDLLQNSDEEIDDVPNASDMPQDLPGRSTYPVYLKIQHPLDLRELGGSSDFKTVFQDLQKLGVISKEENWQDARDFTDHPEASSVFQILEDLGIYNDAKKQGYDGVVISDVDTRGHYHDSWMPFSDSQVKSAIGNKGGFSAENPDIRLSPNTAKKEKTQRRATLVPPRNRFIGAPQVNRQR